jgi:phosphoglycerol transferase MdoB-like AlkP superfamily enzyme
MSKKAESLASSSVIAGLFLGIYLYTGVSIDPQDLLGMVAQAIMGQLAPQYSSLLEIVFIIMAIVGIWQIITMILFGFNFGIIGLVMTITGFVGGVTLCFSPIFGVILLVLSFLIGGSIVCALGWLASLNLDRIRRVYDREAIVMRMRYFLRA